MNKVQLLVDGYAKQDGGGWIATANTTLIITDSKNLIVDPGINKRLLLKNLGKLGLTTGDINYVFMTHYHPDHVFLTALFDNAKVFDGGIVYEKDRETPYKGKIPNTNVEVILTPGHSHEHASLVVPTKDMGVVVVAGDVFWWMDNEKQITDAKTLLAKPDPFVKDKKAHLKSRKLVLSKADWIIPGHGKMFKNPLRK